ncbi:MAG: hypothetical protein U0V72_14490 [Cytophagales bacterium]
MKSGYVHIYKFLLIYVVFLWHSRELSAQYIPPHCKNIATRKWVKLDSLSVIPQSVQVDAALQYEFDTQTNSLKIISSTDSVRVCYQTLSFSLQQPYFIYDANVYKQNYQFSTKNYMRGMRPYTPNVYGKEELFPLSSFEKSGNFTRGISVGNTQGSTINSSLNLQLSGFVSENLKLTGVVSDQNIPAQTEGYTQNVQSFDKIYLQLEQEKRFTATVGDFIMKNSTSGYYLKYLKNVQGLQGVSHYSTGARDTAHTTVGLSFSKGKFASVQLLGTSIASATDATLQEGVLGPYRLTGPNNERFLQIISNSEKVYLDGELLTRGFTNDYTIDYNSGEIKFMQNVIITQYSRVRVDFEYVDRIYARSNYQLSHEHEIGKLKMYANYYEEKDNSRSPITISLTDADKFALRAIGDSLDKAYIDGGDSVGYAAGSILYEKLADTVVNTITYKNIYRYSTSISKAQYAVSFVYVGNGNGDYIISPSLTNGRVYEWVAPVNSLKQGDYSPLRIISTPKQKRMMVAGVAYKLSANDKIYAEVAQSKQDLNLYSPLNDTDNQGRAYKIGYENNGRYIDTTKNWQYLLGIDYEKLDSSFVPVDRFRSTDFDRDWGTTSLNTTNNLNYIYLPKANDQIITGFVGLKNKSSLLKYTHALRQKQNIANATQQKIELEKKYKVWFLKSTYFNMKNNLQNQKIIWNKYFAESGFRFKKFTQGYVCQKEDNQTLQTTKDSVISTSQNFELIRMYANALLDSAQTQTMQLSTEKRSDYKPTAGILKKYTLSRTQQISYASILRKNHQIKLTVTYRTVQYLWDTLGKQDQTLQSRADWNSLFFKKTIKSDLVFTTSTGRELKKEYIYIAVPVGQGTYTWRDDNADGVQQLNEFYEAINFDEKNYIRTYVPTSEYIPLYTSGYIYRATLQYPLSWKNANWYKKQLYKLTANVAYTFDKSYLKNTFWDRLNPFLTSINDTNLLKLNANLRTTVFWNRQNLKFGMDYTFYHQTVKQLLTNGFETRDLRGHQFVLRKSLSSKLSIRTQLETSTKQNSSDFLENKNYLVQAEQIKPELSWQQNQKLRISINATLILKKNTQSVEKSQNKGLGMELRWAKTSQRTLQTAFKYNYLQYNAAANTPLAYDMLEALAVGENYYFSITLIQKLINGLQININYEARKSPKTNIIHLGKIQATALF